MSQMTLIGVLGLGAVAACWALAVVLYRVGSTGSAARMLALLLVVEGVVLVTAGFLDLTLNLTDSFYEKYPIWWQITAIVHTIGDCAMLALYPPFLAATLRTKLTRPFAARRMRVGLGVVSVALFFAVFLSPPEIGLTLLYATMSLLFGYALVASIHAWRVAVSGIARTRAGIFALAFGLRDLCWGFIYAHGISLIVRGLMGESEPAFFSIIYAGGTLFAIPLITYGILRTQLFDIDLRIRWTIKQSTLATIFVTLIFLISEGADRLLSAELGNFAGLLAAAVVVFFLAPLQRFAERVASVAMPNTHNTPEYAAHRKMQVYEAALAEALQEGGISGKERSLLNRLRDSLDISATDAETMEQDLQLSSV
jgi:hypothetical protein